MAYKRAFLVAALIAAALLLTAPAVTAQEDTEAGTEEVTDNDSTVTTDESTDTESTEEATESDEATTEEATTESDESGATPAATDEGADTEGKELADLWENMLHYMKIARQDLALTYCQAIIDSGAEPREIYRMSMEMADSQEVFTRAANEKGPLQDAITQLRKLIEQGYEDERKDPKEIAEAIKTLGGTLQGVKLATDRLKKSGEYAIPQLLQKLMDPKVDDSLYSRIENLLPTLGKEAVRPLAVALQTDNPRLQLTLAGVLGRIGYPSAAPRLKELLERGKLLPEVERTVRAALKECGGEAAVSKSSAELFYELAEKYYYQADSVLPDVRYETANVWYWNPDLGVEYVPVPREIFCDIYAMRMSKLTLEHDPKFYKAVSLWIAAFIKKEADLPEGKTDPTQKEDEPTATYYALAGSTGYLQDVLERALKDRNSAVATGAITALSKTAGAKSLVAPIMGGSQPLIAALTYPDRKVRFLAAVSLAQALPTENYDGDHMVMMVLNEAVRQTGQNRALIIAADQGESNLLKDAARSASYDVIEETDAVKGLSAARKASGIEVVIIGGGVDVDTVVGMLRREPAFAMVPVVVTRTSEALRSLAKSDGRVALISDEDIDAEAVVAAINEARALAAIALSPEEAGEWAVRACEAIRLLGMTNNKVYNIAVATDTLIGALADERDAVRVAAASALAMEKEAKAQQAIANLACNTEATEAVRIAAFGTLSESLRRIGNQLTETQSQTVLDIVTSKESLPLRNAAAQALGAMDLPSERTKDLIINAADR